MKCPICTDVDLVMADRQGIEIDYCPKCRGVWLDRGELDKIIERASPAVQPAPAAPAAPAPVAPVAPSAGPIPAADPRYDDRRYDDRRPDDRRPDDRRYEDRPRRWDDDDDDDDRYKYSKDGYSKKKKRHSILGEIFDF